LVVNPVALSTMEVNPASVAISISYPTPEPSTSDQSKVVGIPAPDRPSVGEEREMVAGPSETLRKRSKSLVPVELGAC